MTEKEQSSSGNGFSDEKRISEDMVSDFLGSWYVTKHWRPGRKEIEFVNSLKPKSCPCCGSKDIVKKGKQKKTGLQRWKCKSCGKRFTPLTGTVFDSRKIPIADWIEYLIHLFEYHSVSSAAYDNRNADSTGYYWLKKVFFVLKGYQDDIVLKSKVWIDETYVSIWKTARTKKGTNELRGLSRNQCCICTGTDGKKTFLIFCGMGKPSSPKAWRSYSPHIPKEATLIHDGERSHNILIEKLALKSEVHSTEETKGMPDGVNPMNEINTVHRYLKRFLSRHDGFDTDELQDWLNLFCFLWNEGPNDYDRVTAFIDRAVRKRALLRYSEWADSE